MEQYKVRRIFPIILLIFLAGNCFGQTFYNPEVIYYRFEQTGNQVNNSALSTTTTTAVGKLYGNLSAGSRGLKGNALIGTGNSSYSDYLDTHWKMDLDSSSWTIGFWLANIPKSNDTFHLFGDTSANNFKCAIGGSAGRWGLELSGGGLNSLTLQNLGSGPVYITLMYDNYIKKLFGYVNGKLIKSVQQYKPYLRGNSTLQVGGFGKKTGMAAGMLIDEFRIYRRTLGAKELTETWMNELPYTISNMTYFNTEVHQYTTDAGQGQKSVNILKSNIKTQGTNLPIYLNKLYIDISSSTSISDIEKVRIHFTGSQNPEGFAINEIDNIKSYDFSPSNKLLLNQDIQLLPGNNYFLVSFDLKHTSKVNNVLDASIDSIIIDDTLRYVPKGNPTGNRKISVHPVYCSQAVLLKNTTSNLQAGITSVRINSFTNYSSDSDRCVFYGNSTVKVYRMEDLKLEVSAGKGYNEQVGAWVDWNNDGLFSSNEKIFYTGNLDPGYKFSYQVKVPCNISSGIKRIRFVSDYILAPEIDPCLDLKFGESEDYLLEILDDQTPQLKFSFDKPIYLNSPVKFTNESVFKTNSICEWEFDNNGKWIKAHKDLYISFNKAGTHRVKLKITQPGCDSNKVRLKMDTFSVIMQTKVPETDFIASNNTISINDTVRFTDLSRHGPTGWKWKVEPEEINGKQPFQFINGTSLSSKNPVVVFTDTGKFTIELEASNSIGKGKRERRSGYIQSYKIFKLSKSDTITHPFGILTDDMGPDSPYRVYRSQTLLIKPLCAKQITLNFESFDVSKLLSLTGGDYLKVYDGVNKKGIPLHDSAGFPNGFRNDQNNNPIQIPPLIANSGSIFLVWRSDSLFVKDGFVARWSSILKTDNSPQAHLDAPDTIFVHQSATFNSQSTGNDLEYFWDLDSDGQNDLVGPDFYKYNYHNSGVYKVRLIVRNCGGTDTAFKTLVVKDPITKPKVNFKVDFTNAAIGDILNFTDLSSQGPYYWRWEISGKQKGAKFRYVKGTSRFSQNPKIEFLDTGIYSVGLFASNDIDTGFVYKQFYIRITNICIPRVEKLYSDLCISEIKIYDPTGALVLSNKSSGGIVDYTYFDQISPVPLVIGGRYTAVVKRKSKFNKMSGGIWVDYNGDGDFSDLFEKAYILLDTNDSTWIGNFTIPNGVFSGRTRIRFGVGFSKITPESCGINSAGEFEDYPVYIIMDEKPPVIILNSTDTILVEEGKKYVDPGAKAYDNSDGDISNRIVVDNKVVNTVSGIYTVTYSVSDRIGNKTTKKRVVIVIADTTKPQITLVGSKEIYHEVSTYFIDPGASAFDNMDGQMPVNIIGKVDSTRIGTYYLDYIATDKRGNTSTITRKVIVGDTTLPVITLLGDNPLKMQINSSYSDPGYVAFDNYLWNQLVTVINEIDTSKIGTYKVWYSATDSSGNGPVKVYRTVKVDDLIKPTLKLISDTLLWSIYKPFTQPQHNKWDNYYISSQLKLYYSGYINEYRIGDYVLKFFVKDPSGNVSDTNVLYVKVRDFDPPVIKLLGISEIIIPQFNNYIEPGFTLFDNYDRNPKIKIGGTFINTATQGIFYRTYTAFDSTGNISKTVTRWITVGTPAGVHDQENINGIKIYPNPAKNYLTIDFGSFRLNSEIEVKLFDITGRNICTLFQGTVTSGSLNTQLPSINGGLYIIEIYSSTQQIRSRLVISE